jgi:hypothetical protein
MAQTFKITGKVELPLEDGQTPATMSLDTSFTFTQRANQELSFSAAAADVAVNLGTLAVGGAKALMVKSPTGGCVIKLNGSTDAIPVPSGSTGYMLIVNPGAGAITSVSVTVTGVAIVKIIAVG